MRKERLKRQLREVIFQSMKMEWLGAKLGVRSPWLVRGQRKALSTFWILVFGPKRVGGRKVIGCT
jgi:hypothetical protein